jgi:hypothetical protein
MSRIFNGILILLVFASSSLLIAGITATPKILFLDGTHRSVPVHVSNSSDAENEVWVEIQYGYVGSDDTGKVIYYLDSLSNDPSSAAAWIQVYPKRFILGAGETQTIRLTATPPASLADGEYWADILIASKPRKAPPSATPGQTAPSTGFILKTQLGLPFHYRRGKVITGVQVTDFKAIPTQEGATVSMKLTRSGNASYWGTRTIRIINAIGKVMYTETKNTVVYKTMNVVDKIARGELAPGVYTIDVEFITGKRLDIKADNLIQSPPARISLPLQIQ